MLRLSLGSLELVFADVLPKPFSQFGPGEWVFADHCGQRGGGLHGFTKGVFGVAAFFGVGIGQLERAGLGCQAKNQPCFGGKAIDWNHGNAERACDRSNPVNRNFRS
jgi:hypothetical protein